jgi:hypothetical protein
MNTENQQSSASAHAIGMSDAAASAPFVDPNPNKGETDYGIVDAARDLIYESLGIDGQPITITVSALMPTAPGKNVGGRKVTASRGVITAAETTEEAA